MLRVFAQKRFSCCGQLLPRLNLQVNQPAERQINVGNLGQINGFPNASNLFQIVLREHLRERITESTPGAPIKI